MKKVLTKLVAVCFCAGLWLGMGLVAEAASSETIRSGVFAEDVDLSGMTQEEAQQAVQAYVDALGQRPITLESQDGKSVTVTVADLGMTWGNPDLVEEAMNFGTAGNMVQRYKALKDLEHENKVFEVEVNFDLNTLANVVNEKCSDFNQEAVDAHLKRENGSFVVEEGQTGYVVDAAASAQEIYDTLTQADWLHSDVSADLVMTVDEPQGKSEDLLKVKDVLGTFTTSFSSSGTSRSANVTNGCELINGTTLYPGEEFSTYEKVSPFSEENGYYMAGSYLNGKVVDSIGGGICQVSTTLYNAVLRAELEVTERHNHSMIVNYVDPSADAAIAESSGKDFCFVNNTEYPIYIEGSVSNKKITFTIYGVEYRDSNRKVTYESEVLEKIDSTKNITADGGQLVGYIQTTENGHTGYKAKLWKVVTVDGKEVSREQVNSSNYKMTPTTVSVGVASADPNVTAQVQAAIATGDLNTVKTTVANLQAISQMTQEQQQALQAAQAAAAAAAQAQAEAQAAAGQALAP